MRDEVLFAYADNLQWLDDPFFQAGFEPAAMARVRSPENLEQGRKDSDIAKYRAGLEMGRKNLKALSDAGVKIAFGTDSGIPTRFPGYFEHRELQRMVEAGLTHASRRRRDRDECRNSGRDKAVRNFTIWRADFLVLDANRLDDIHSTERLSAVWQPGKIVPSVSVKRMSGN